MRKRWITYIVIFLCGMSTVSGRNAFSVAGHVEVIRLREETEQLEEVVVLQKAPLVERRMDKIIMNVASSPFAIWPPLLPRQPTTAVLSHQKSTFSNSKIVKQLKINALVFAFFKVIFLHR